PIENFTGGTSAYNEGLQIPVSSIIAKIPAGAQGGAVWVRTLGGGQSANDPDNPTAGPH
ncbi:hypothetical protein CPB86DRAFT_677599, partial [Serendipita vermifera]